MADMPTLTPIHVTPVVAIVGGSQRISLLVSPARNRREQWRQE